MKSIILFLTLALTQLFANAQNETKHWCFGSGHHLLFDTSSVQVLSNCSISTPEAASSISDTNGNLLFYTNGKTVWNKLHQVMQNGSGLVGSWSATQCLIVKQPLSDSLYYIFYADGWGGSAGANYAIVNISLNAGLGSVISKNNLLFTPSSEKFSAIKSANDTDVWVMTRTVNPTSFRAYLLTSSGLNLTPTISYDSTTESNGIGQMKFSHDGTLLALAISDMHVYELLDFNDSTGVLSNPRLSTVFSTNSNYGIEFSPNDSILYATMNIPPVLLKFDLTTTGNPLLSYTVIDTSACFALGSLQLALDGNIYVGRNFISGSGQAMGVIHYPNSWNFATYVDSALALNNYVNWSLPNFEQSLLRNVPSETPTSIKNINRQINFTVYPNPFTQTINVVAPFEFSEINLTDIYGRTVFNTQLLQTNKFEINLSKLPKGMYFITISSKRKQLTNILVHD